MKAKFKFPSKQFFIANFFKRIIIQVYILLKTDFNNLGHPSIHRHCSENCSSQFIYKCEVTSSHTSLNFWATDIKTSSDFSANS